MDFLTYIPPEFIKFILVLVFSLLIGLEQRRHHINENEDVLFGTDRTFTFIGLLAYVLFIADPVHYIPFLAGFLLVGILLGIQYFQRISRSGKFGLTSTILALLTYCIPIMVFTQPVWLMLSFVVALLILTELKSSLISLSQKASEEEFITLGTFIVLAGVVLPLLPDKNFSEHIPVSPYHLWLAIVVVSGISYCSYLLKKFVFPDSGLAITGLLGGLYSSTATTVILARKEKQGSSADQTVSAIMLANGMMYLRILFLAFIFNTGVALKLSIPFLVMFLLALGLSYFSKSKAYIPATTDQEANTPAASKNPLEFKTAAVFGVLFVFFAIVTDVVSKKYGGSGITGLAYIVGVTDIDPFLLNLLQGDSFVLTTIVLAIINATNSNNVLKMVYGATLCSKSIRKKLITDFIILIFGGLFMTASVYFIS